MFRKSLQPDDLIEPVYNKTVVEYPQGSQCTTTVTRFTVRIQHEETDLDLRAEATCDSSGQWQLRSENSRLAGVVEGALLKTGFAVKVAPHDDTVVVKRKWLEKLRMLLADIGGNPCTLCAATDEGKERYDRWWSEAMGILDAHVKGPGYTPQGDAVIKEGI